mmetsp:Transcript_14968/g.21408  ORF Transcript_14968/g.21408 Transcript_14968/m.21408 type:complete len:274 (-) Transcript_14968:449-1270(-)
MSETTRSYYAPTGDELAEAISTYLKEVNSENKITAVQMCQLLKTENPSWKIQEKRVSRYLKRELKMQKKIDGSKDEINDDASIYSSTSLFSLSSIKSKLKYKKKNKKRGMFKKKSNIDEDTEKSPTDFVIDTGSPKETKTNLLPSIEQDDNADEDNLHVSISEQVATDQETLNTEVTSLSMDGDQKDSSTKNLELSEQTFVESIPEKETENADDIPEEVEGMVEHDTAPLHETSIEDVTEKTSEADFGIYLDDTVEKEEEKTYVCDGLQCTIM